MLILKTNAIKQFILVVVNEATKTCLILKAIYIYAVMIAISNASSTLSLEYYEH